MPVAIFAFLFGIVFAIVGVAKWAGRNRRRKRCQEPFACRPEGCFAQKVPDTFFSRWARRHGLVVVGYADMTGLDSGVDILVDLQDPGGMVRPARITFSSVWVFEKNIRVEWL